MNLELTQDQALLDVQLAGIPTGMNLKVAKVSIVENTKKTGPQSRAHYLLLTPKGQLVKAVESLWEEGQATTPVEGVVTVFRREYTTEGGETRVTLDALTLV